LLQKEQWELRGGKIGSQLRCQGSLEAQMNIWTGRCPEVASTVPSHTKNDTSQGGGVNWSGKKPSATR